MIIVIRGIALGQIGSSNARWLMYKELAVTALNGIAWALVVAVIATLWFEDINIGLIRGTALSINLSCAALAGLAIPFILERLQIAAAPAGPEVLPTITDVVGFMVFLGLGTMFLL